MIHRLPKVKYDRALADAMECHTWCRKMGFQHNHNFKGDSLKINEEGYLGEITWSDASGEEYYGFRKDYQSNPADVGLYYQVRATRCKTGRMLCHESDRKYYNQIFVLVRLHNIANLEAEIVGWLYGFECVVESHWDCGQSGPAFEERPCFVVPTYKLRKVDYLLPTSWVPL